MGGMRKGRHVLFHTFLGFSLRASVLKSVLFQAQLVEKGFALKEGRHMGFDTPYYIHIAYKWPVTS